ncbi:muscle M-line assembly protein unc-89-like [Branchiostoma floridae]|uniref:Muscle M-line assembly protein unc-89-like n=1 Tax=Branchiostoma floridae TaxID=7739 RepID=C3YK99_BRAFL|nr:muscle M-line assembly protein unc-89-like [Branchiostoma floridae]|eukprot:XP_002603249.1 hypothetical protein BRAFLDRAFT_93314 [Branchiostoma floridae]
MGVRDRIASAYLTVVSALSVLRPSSQWWTSESQLNVVVHEGKVGRHSQAKYLVTIRHGKEKKQTKKKKSDSLLWEEAAEFSRWTPKDPLILKLRKVKRCKDATIAELSIDVATVLESVDGLPNRWWYAMKRLDKSGRQKEDVFLQITVTVDGQHVKSGATQDPAKPAKKAATTAAQEKPQTPPELKANSPTAASTSDESDKAFTKRENKPSRDERRPLVSQEEEGDNSPPSEAGNVTDFKADTSHRSRDKTVEVPQVTATVDGHDVDDDTGLGTDPTRLSEKMATGQDDPESSTEGNKVFKDAKVTMAVDDGSGRSQDPANPDNEFATTAAQEKISTKKEDKTTPERRSSGSQEGETGTSDSSRRTNVDTSPPSAAGDIPADKPASSTPPSEPPASLDSPDTGTSGRGEGDVKAGPERHKDKAVEVSEVPAAADCPTTCMGNVDSGRGHAKPREDFDMKEVVPVSDENLVVPHLTAMSCPMDDTDLGRGPTAESASTKKTAMTVAQEKPEPRVDPKDAMTEMYLRNLKRILARREFPQHLVPKYAWMTAALTDTETEQPPADSNTDTDGPGETAQGGGEVLPTANQHPEHKGKDDPEFEKMRHVWKIEDLWDEFTTMREQADELLEYAESLRAKLAASVPHVLQYPVIKNLAAYLPERKPYDFPDTEGLSIDELEDIKDNLAKLLKDEENRAKFLKKWYIEKMLRVAMEEAPQVLGPQSD